MQDERFIIKAAEMYYKNNISQQEIAKRLNVSRTTISRALTRAKAEGYVEIKINYPEGGLMNEEARLESKYALREAIVARQGDGSSVAEQVGAFAADYVLRTIHGDMTIGLTRGTTLKCMVESLAQDVRLKFLKTESIDVVPMMPAVNLPANLDRGTRLAYSNYLVDEFAHTLGANGYQLLTPQYVSSPDAKRVLLNEPSVASVFDKLRSADLAVFGIGTVGEGSTLVKAGVLDAQGANRLKKSGGVSEVLAHILDEDGNVIDGGFEERLMSLSLEDLKNIPIRVGVAFGMEKKEAIRSVLRGGIANVLITDEDVARFLVEE